MKNIWNDPRSLFNGNHFSSRNVRTYGHHHIIGERAKQARHSQVCSIENRGFIYIQVKKKAFKINAKIEDVGLNED